MSIGGNWNNGSNYGSVCWNVNNALGNSNTNYGARKSLNIAKIILLGSNKRKLHTARKRIAKYLKGINLGINKKWQVFPVTSRRVDFCGVATNHENSHIRRTIFKKLIKNIRRILKGAYTRITAMRYFAYNRWIANSDSGYMFSKLMKGIRIGKLKHIVRLEAV